MLSRGNSEAATRLRRAKSTSSVQSKRPSISECRPLDHETAHQHAVVAASHAYEAAHGRGSPQKRECQAGATAGDEAGQHLERRQSIRFTGPSAITVKQRPITRRQAPQSSTSRPAIKNAASFERHGPEALSYGVPQSSEYVERRVSSTPSSYKKIRKSKSMFNPSKGPSLSFMTGSTKNRGPDAGNARPEARTRRSLSLSHQQGASNETSTKIADQDAAVQLARDTYVRQLEQQRLKEKSSFMEFAKPRKSARAFRRTVRTSSTTSYGSAIESSNVHSKEPSKANGIGCRARGVSISLVNKFKKVFQKPSETGRALPKQHLHADRPHFADYMATSNGVQQRYEHHIPSPDGESLRRVDSRGSTCRDTSAFVERQSQPGSIRSVHSDTSSVEAPSRVSSWDNSTVGGTLASRQAKENKRLSIIHEHGGPYQPSSSKRSYGDLSRCYAAFNDPLRREFSAGSLFSRLKKEIAENERVARLGNEHDKVVAKQQIADLTPRGSSYKARNLSRGTISEESADTGDPFSGVRTSRSIIFNPIAKGGDRGEETGMVNSGGNPSLKHPISSEDGDTTPKGPLREIRSTFFPPSTHIERSSTSPFRRAMTSSSEEGTMAQPARAPHTSTMSSAKDNNTGYLHVRSRSRSDSIYSRTTSGNTPAPSPSPPSRSDSEYDHGVGIAMVDSSVTKYQKSPSPTPQSRRSSTKSSGDWQKFLASEMAQLDDRTLETSDDQEISPASTIGHKRESAQLDNEDVEVRKSHIQHGSAIQPLATFSATNSSNHVLPHGEAEITAERPPLVEIGSSRSGPRKEHSLSKPALPTGLRVRASHASLTNTSSNANLNKRYGINIKPSQSGSSETLRAAASVGQLRPQKTGKLSSKDSPERQARLRRMQSRNSIEQRRQQEDKSTPPSAGGRENARPSLETSSFDDGHSPGSQLMMERFLNDRRRGMRISEESGMDPAFL